VTCPAKTITDSDDRDDWYIDQEKCYTVWRNIGTDCGICISACPIAQGVDVENLKNMTKSDMQSFCDDYTKKNGTRKYTHTDYFDRE
jgi:Fe-S-cluster-containing hydrogenase component 2